MGCYEENQEQMQLRKRITELEAEIEKLTEVVHMCPRDGEILTPCCGVTPFELPRWSSRMTVDPELVTCGVDSVL